MKEINGYKMNLNNLPNKLKIRKNIKEKLVKI